MLIQQLIDGADIASTVVALDEASSVAGMSSAEVEDTRFDAFQAWANRAVEDQVLSPEEEERIDALADGLGISVEAIHDLDPELARKIAVASINGGNMPVVDSPQLIARMGEIVHAEIQAALMKEVAIKEYRGGYQGVSVPIGKTGIRYKVGGVRGHVVQTGTQMQVADQGILAVSSKRVVYIGGRKTMEMPYAKLVSLSVFEDGLQFHMSNRVNAPLFTTGGNSDMIAALVNVAAEKEAS